MGQTILLGAAQRRLPVFLGVNSPDFLPVLRWEVLGSVSLVPFSVASPGFTAESAAGKSL